MTAWADIMYCVSLFVPYIIFGRRTGSLSTCLLGYIDSVFLLWDVIYSLGRAKPAYLRYANVHHELK